MGAAGSLWHKTYIIIIMFSFIFLAKFSWLIPFFFSKWLKICVFFSDFLVAKFQQVFFFFTNFLDFSIGFWYVDQNVKDASTFFKFSQNFFLNAKMK
jgi:hypothetical protein